MTATNSTVFLCNGLAINEKEFSIVKHGEILPVEPRAFRVLIYLLRNPQRLITKEELLQSVWGDVAVTENSLARAILKLRQCLEDDARSPQYIETVATVGYRWVCPVEQVDDLIAVSAVPEPSLSEEPSKTELVTSVALPYAGHAPAPAGHIARSYSRPVWIAAIMLFLVAWGTIIAVYFHTRLPAGRRVKAQILLPESESTLFGLSPDGRFLNFASCEAFTCRIWIRPLDRLDAQLIGDGRYAVFWSPDSKYFVFCSGGKFYKMSPTGGSPVVLANAPPSHFTGGAWLDGGTIVIAVDDGLYKVPVSGGIFTKFMGQTAFTVSWLPGGRFLYSNREGVFVGLLNGNKPVSVLPDIIRGATYVPPARFGLRGHLVFVRNGALLAQEFDPDKSQFYGNPMHIVASGSDPGGVYINDFAASRNGVLAFRSGEPNRVALTWLDRSGNKLEIVSEPFNLAGNPTIRLSPDDSKAIVDVSGINERRDLWVADLIRRTLSRFTFDGAVGGLWSPDGHAILWADLDFHHYLKTADGSGNNELLYNNPICAGCLVYDWSQDGKFSSFGGFNGGKANIWLAHLEGDQKPFPYREVGFNNFYGMFSPDRRWLAYTSDESGQNQIYVESIPAGKKRWQVSTEGGNWPIWRRDGKELFYRQDNTIVSVPIRFAVTGLEIGRPQRLFTVPPLTRFQVSRDGQRFLIALPVEGTPASSSITIDTDWRAGLGSPN